MDSLRGFIGAALGAAVVFFAGGYVLDLVTGGDLESRFALVVVGIPLGAVAGALAGMLFGRWRSKRNAVAEFDLDGED